MCVGLYKADSKVFISSWKLAISRLVSLAASVQQLHKNAYIAKKDFW